jgi:hypothetical protein
MSTVRALVVDDGRWEVRPLGTDLDSMRKALGGECWVDLFAHSAGGWYLIHDEHAVRKGLPYNHLATMVRSLLVPGRQLGHLLGPVVFLGLAADGGDTDVPQHVIDTIEFMTARLDHGG